MYEKDIINIHPISEFQAKARTTTTVIESQRSEAQDLCPCAHTRTSIDAGSDFRPTIMFVSVPDDKFRIVYVPTVDPFRATSVHDVLAGHQHGTWPWALLMHGNYK